MVAHRRPLRERFEAKVNRTPGCWLWTGAKTSVGYGLIQDDAPSRRSLAAHRLAYEWANGPIPEGLVIDHLCRVRECVRPEHLEAVSSQVNVERGPNYSSNRSACPHGHLYGGDNVWVDKRGKRYCRTCQRAQSRDYYRRKRGYQRV